MPIKFRFPNLEIRRALNQKSPIRHYIEMMQGKITKNPEVEVQQGRLRGSTMVDMDGQQFYSFLGIPYAKPPVGQLRFKAPEPAEAWEGVRDATKDGDCCFQREIFGPPKIAGSEDCLNLNVFTKTLFSENSSLKPVMLFIHGGAFVYGSNSSSFQGPEFLMTHDVVLVSINYRLGIMGFLSVEDLSLQVPGNAGLKDQTMAMKWVQRNIARFNGDPHNVTIFGVSAGAGSVHFQVLSPTAKGLFHKAMCHSGSALNPWSYGAYLREYIKLIDENIKTEKEALEMLTKLPVEKLFEYQEKIIKEKGADLVYFGPVIEKPNPTAFMTSHAMEIITSGKYNKVPMIFGYASNEGLVAEKFEKITGMEGEIPKKKAFEDYCYPEWNLSPDVRKQMGQMFSDFYNREDNVHDKCMLASDFHFVAGIMASVVNHAKTSGKPVHLYRMSYDGTLSFKKFLHIEEYPGVFHGNDMAYIFHISIFPNDDMVEEDKKTIRRLTSLFTSFAKTGNPTPPGNNLDITWPPVDHQNINFLDIDEDLILGTNPEPDRVNLWRKVFNNIHQSSVKFL